MKELREKDPSIPKLSSARATSHAKQGFLKRYGQIFIGVTIVLSSAMYKTSPWASRNGVDVQVDKDYRSEAVKEHYELNRHFGHYYELAYRDLYPSPTQFMKSDCHHTEKRKGGPGGALYDEWFAFQVQAPMLGWLRFQTIITLHEKLDGFATYSQIMFDSRPQPPGDHQIETIRFHTSLVDYGEKEGQDQYEWVLEFTGGHSYSEGSTDTFKSIFSWLFPDPGYVGINLYSKSPPHSEQGAKNFRDMMASVDKLGLTWTTEDWGFYWPYHYGFFVVPHGTHCVYDDAPKLLDGMGEWVFVEEAK